MGKKGLISLNAMDKIMRKAGGLRISNSAKAALAKVLEEKALGISADARKFAEHAGRRTITERDIQMSAKA
ncbi:MAG: histone [Nanoarchaeota archaeon]